MNWKDIGRKVASAAPLIGTALGGPAGAAVGALISKALGAENSPDAVDAVIAQNPDALLKLKQLEADHEAELQKMVLEAETARLAEINQTMRAEAAATDAYVRRWRPTWGYSAALAFTIQMLGATAAIIWAVISTPAQAGQIIAAIGSALSALSVIWGVALAVLGVAVQARTTDKQVSAGIQPQGILAALAQRLASKGQGAGGNGA